MAGVKPRVGDLVKLNDLEVEARAYWGVETTQVGLIIRCVGIRCHVQWTGGQITKPERAVLEVVNQCKSVI